MENWEALLWGFCQEMRGTDLYKYSRGGRERAPISLVMAPLSLEIWPLAMEKEWMGLWSRAFVKVFTGLKERYDFRLTLFKFKAQVKNEVPALSQCINSLVEA